MKDEVQKPSNIKCNVSSSEPSRSDCVGVGIWTNWWVPNCFSASHWLQELYLLYLLCGSRSKWWIIVVTPTCSSLRSSSTLFVTQVHRISAEFIHIIMMQLCVRCESFVGSIVDKNFSSYQPCQQVKNYQRFRDCFCSHQGLMSGVRFMMGSEVVPEISVFLTNGW